MRANYYGDPALAELRKLAEVELHEADDALTPSQLVAAGRNADVIVADRMTTGPSELFSDSISFDI